MKAALQPIGRIETPYRTLGDCPSNIDPDGPVCEIILDPAFTAGLAGLKPGMKILLLYWLEHADRGKLVQQRHKTGHEKGVFALRSPHRPNPIGAAVLAIESLSGRRIRVRGLDCLDGTPLLDIKPALGDRPAG